jgi:hypothetical protein
MSGKRNWEKIEREQAEKEGRQSEERERTIAELSRAIEQLESSRKHPGEGILADARELAAQWKVKKRPLFEGLLESKRLVLLVALVVALRRSHERLEQIGKYFPNELASLINASSDAEFRAFASALSGTLSEPPPKRKYERKRRRWRRNFFSSIEYQFGGAAEAEQRKLLSGLPYEPTCLDDIFAGKTVNMQRLEQLFAVDRHRLSEALQRASKPPYNYLDVVQIMHALLSENPRKRRKRRGRSPRTPWLKDPDGRMRVLNGIMARIKRLSVQPNIANEFLTVIRPHVAESGKK